MEPARTASQAPTGAASTVNVVRFVRQVRNEDRARSVVRMPSFEQVASDAVLRQAYDDADWPAVEERVRRLLFEKPQEFWNLPKLQEVFKTDRLPSLREILARVFGLIPEIPTRGQLADEAFERFIATQETDATHSRELRTVFVAFLLDPQSRLLLEAGRFPDLRARDASLYGSLLQLSLQEREALVGYLQSQVPLKDFEQVA